MLTDGRTICKQCTSASCYGGGIKSLLTLFFNLTLALTLTVKPFASFFSTFKWYIAWEKLDGEDGNEICGDG